MEVTITGAPDYGMAEVSLGNGEQMQVEAGAMAAMSPNIGIETKARGGLLSSAKRLLGSESFFVNTYTAQDGPGSLFLSPGPPGDIRHRTLGQEDFFIQSGSYVASSPSVNLDTKWGGAKTFFGGEGLFILRASGPGDVIFNSFGAIHEVDVQGSYTVDTGHIVAFEQSLTFNIQRVGGLKSLFLSGEGLVCRFSGSGKLYLQTRKPAGFVHWIHGFRRVKAKSNG